MARNWEVEFKTESQTILIVSHKIVIPRIGEDITVRTSDYHTAEYTKKEYRVVDIVHNYNDDDENVNIEIIIK